MGQPKRRNVEGECNDQRKQYRLWDKYHCRGANVGTIDGNTKVAIKQLNGTLTNYYGGGVGSSATNAANVTGNVETTIATKNANFRLGTFVGGFSMERSTVESTALFPVVEAGLGQPIVLSAVPIMEILARNLLKMPS